MDTIISVKGIGKKYNIMHQRGRYTTLRDVLANIINSPFKFFKQKAKQVAGIAQHEDFWALKNINFEVKRGEVVGIIGRNGAGKSTLLKILSQITPPTEGEITIKGRVGSLLEVGTGFHPELTGRENIFLNGAILGMTKKEIAKKFDQIVEFAGIEKFLDTPVKHYSSGMYVRLAFSVAAHMEPDILIVDEVLAVGDAEFQKKCLGKMDEITKTDGRTILFVSHNMGAITQLCKKTVLLESGKIKFYGDTDKALSIYADESQTQNVLNVVGRRFPPTRGVKIIDAKISGDIPHKTKFNYGDRMALKIDIEASARTDKMSVEVLLRDMDGHPIIFLPSGLRFKKEFSLAVGHHSILVNIPSLPLATGKYYLDLILAETGTRFLDYIERGLSFEIVSCDPMKTGREYSQNSKQGSVHIMADFSEIVQNI